MTPCGENLRCGLMGFTAKPPECLTSHSPKRTKQLCLPELFLLKVHFFTAFLNLHLLSLLDSTVNSGEAYSNLIGYFIFNISIKQY